MWLNGELQSADHVFVGRFQFVEKHFLVEHLGEGAAHRRHYPDPVRGAPSPRLLLVLHVLHERLGGRVVVRDGHAHLLKKKIINDVKRRRIYVKIAMYKDGRYE